MDVVDCLGSHPRNLFQICTCARLEYGSGRDAVEHLVNKALVTPVFGSRSGEYDLTSSGKKLYTLIKEFKELIGEG